ncbi:MAG: PTS sugar transporter subunit IIA [Planctomycetes bacterium]|nr:PTS sugar transporter subunit IIA [Planctomycetota bacterium]
MIRLTRFLKPPQVKVELETRTPAEVPEGWSRERFVWSVKDAVLEELAALLDASGKIVNPTKLLADLLQREKKATTAVGHGVAIPHVRTMQAREFSMCFARSTPGVEFDAVDGAPVHFFLAVVSPPYDDRLYLQVYKALAEILIAPGVRASLLEAETAHDVIKVISRFGD